MGALRPAIRKFKHHSCPLCSSMLMLLDLLLATMLFHSSSWTCTCCTDALLLSSTHHPKGEREAKRFTHQFVLFCYILPCTGEGSFFDLRFLNCWKYCRPLFRWSLHTGQSLAIQNCTGFSKFSYRTVYILRVHEQQFSRARTGFISTHPPYGRSPSCI